MRNFCTYFDIGYLRQGLALHSSMERHCQPYHLWILALDEETGTALNESRLAHVTVVSMADFETAELHTARSNRTWREYIWTCTGSWLLYVLGQYGLDHLCYIDADCYFFSSPEPMFEEIGSAPVAITPHRYSPACRRYEPLAGTFNVGLVYVKVPDGLPCIQEWAEECIQWCYLRRDGERYADQGYLDKWPSKWHAHVIQHKGANLAPWNQADQYIYSVREGQIYVDNEPLIWYHFHEGLQTGYGLDPFVRQYVYEPYREALR